MPELENIAAAKHRNILSGDLFYHATKRRKLESIVTYGLLSPTYAQRIGVTIDVEFPGSSLPDFVYLSKSADQRKENTFFITTATSSFLHPGFVVVLLSREGVLVEKARPWSDPEGMFSLDEVMTKDFVQQGSLVGFAVATEVFPRVVNKNEEMILDAIRRAYSNNPELAVPLYDQIGNIIWPDKLNNHLYPK